MYVFLKCKITIFLRRNCANSKAKGILLWNSDGSDQGKLNIKKEQCRAEPNFIEKNTF